MAAGLWVHLHKAILILRHHNGDSRRHSGKGTTTLITTLGSKIYTFWAEGTRCSPSQDRTWQPVEEGKGQ